MSGPQQSEKQYSFSSKSKTTINNNLYSRIVYKCYEFQVSNIDVARYKFWAKNVRFLLLSYGFGEVWEHQGVGNEAMFLKIFKQRCTDIDIQSWMEHVSQPGRLETYSTFKKELRMEPYLSLVEKPVFRLALCKFRVSAHCLKVETGRWNNIPRMERLCDLCTSKYIEDEFHFLLVCPKYSDLRAKYIPDYFHNPPVLFKFILLLSSEKVVTIRKLSRYIFHATKRRQELLNNVQT